MAGFRKDYYWTFSPPIRASEKGDPKKFRNSKTSSILKSFLPFDPYALFVLPYYDTASSFHQRLQYPFHHLTPAARSRKCPTTKTGASPMIKAGPQLVVQLSRIAKSLRLDRTRYSSSKSGCDNIAHQKYKSQSVARRQPATESPRNQDVRPSPNDNNLSLIQATKILALLPSRCRQPMAFLAALFNSLPMVDTDRRGGL